MYNGSNVIKRILCLCIVFLMIIPFEAFAANDNSENIVFYVGDSVRDNVASSIKYGNGRTDHGYGFYRTLYLEYDAVIENVF